MARGRGVTARAGAAARRNGSPAGAHLAAPTACVCARQWALSGQRAQSGAALVHSVAPSSIIAWLRSPGRLASTSSAASRQNSLTLCGAFGLAPTARRRETTRITLPSTSGTASLYTIDAIAPAV